MTSISEDSGRVLSTAKCRWDHFMIFQWIKGTCCVVNELSNSQVYVTVQNDDCRIWSGYFRGTYARK